MVDTVKNAELTPDEEQPWAELGLNAEEYGRIRDILGRRPTGSELAMYSVMWAEHCSYKSSKVHLKRFGVLDPVTPRGPLLAGIGDNAGVVDIGQGYAVTFKAESHNSPSYVEPHQGAATGIGGIVRDILAMGARPVAVMDALRFGPLDGPDTPRVMHGAVAGISNYGNSLGLPNIGGELMFDQSYAGNPLVNALAVGVLRHEDLKFAQATGVGNRVIMYGARTGGDGIGGASILSSQSFDSAAESKRPAVQVGDPFMEKLLIEATLELFEAGVISALQDFGAAGISCATSELASAGEGGMWVDLNQVKLRDHTLTPEEILMSESQERMMAIVEPDKVEQFMEICAKWEVEAADIGEVTDGERLIIEYDGEVIVDVPPRTVAHEGPVYERPYERRVSQDAIEADSSDMLARPHTGEQLAETFRAVLASPNQADKSWVTDQYDRFVRGNTVLAQPEDSGVIRVDEDTNLGFALSVDANSRFTWLNPYLGAQLSLLEAYRNVATTGATPVAITDCLNYGSPEDPEVMWSFVETIKGLVDGCRELGTPVTGGNVSFYNQTDEVAVLPTPLIGMLGVIDDVRHHNPMGFRETDHEIWQLGVTHEELDGSAWADAAHGHLGGRPPRVDFAAERNLAAVLIAAAQEQLVSSAHDLADGGLAVALAESCLRHGVGARVRLEGDPFVGLFSESGARAIVSVTGDNAARLAELAAEHGVAAGRLGETTDQAQIEVEGQFALPLDTVGQAWSAVLPEALDGAVEADVVG